MYSPRIKRSNESSIAMQERLRVPVWLNRKERRLVQNIIYLTFTYFYLDFIFGFCSGLGHTDRDEDQTTFLPNFLPTYQSLPQGCCTVRDEQKGRRKLQFNDLTRQCSSHLVEKLSNLEYDQWKTVFQTSMQKRIIALLEEGTKLFQK